MSTITNDGLTRSGTGFLYSCSRMTTVNVEGYTQWRNDGVAGGCCVS